MSDHTEFSIPDGACSELADLVVLAMCEATPGKPSHTEVHDACCWYVALRYAAEQHETNSVKDWARLLQRGTNPIDMEWIADWYEDRIAFHCEDRWYEDHDDEMDLYDPILDEFRADFWDRERAYVRQHFGLPTQA